MQKFSTKFKAGVSAVAVLAVLFGVYGFRKLQALAADPDGEKNCRTANNEDQGKADLEKKEVIALIAYLKRLGRDLHHPSPTTTAAGH